MIFKNIRNYLANEKYNINVFPEGLYILNYDSVISISDRFLIVKFNDFNLKVQGEAFLINKMLDKEILLKGKIETIIFEYK